MSVFSLPVNLSNCDEEPIHIPGSIQTHGVMLAVDNQSHIVMASDNAKHALGLKDNHLLGQSLGTYFSQPFAQSIAHLIQTGQLAADEPGLIFTLALGGKEWNVIGHQCDELSILEFEPATKQADWDSFAELNVAQKHLKNANTLLAFHEASAIQVKRLTGFDRVMIYQFDPDGHGEVVAEAKEAHLEPFLGLHYPAADIPRQARELYLKNRLRFITDVNYTPVPVLPVLNPVNQKPLDMGHAVLRSVSPIHVEYLQNMGVSATMTISIIINNKLWGLVACHHYDTLYVPYEARMVCDALGMFLSLELGSREQQQAIRDLAALKAMQTAFVEFMVQEDSLVDGLIKYHPNVSDYIQATGVAVFLQGKSATLGNVPPNHCLTHIMTWLDSQMLNDHQTVIATQSLPLLLEEMAPYKKNACGLLAISVNDEPGDYVLWFRPEVYQTVDWAGDPNKQVEMSEDGTRLSPRGSFALWRETVSQQSLPWQAFEIQAASEIRTSIMRIQVHKSEQEKKQLKAHKAQLEKTVAERTAELRETNAQLKQEMESRAQTEEILRQSQKMEAVGQLTGGLAHDFNNLLTVILGNLELIQLRVDNPKVQRYASLAITAADRGSKLTQQLLAFSRRQQLDATVLCANTVVASLQDLVAQSLAANIHVQTQLDPALWHIKIDQTQLEVALINILVNARDAMPQGGNIIVTTQNMVLKVQDKVSYPDFKPGNYVCIAISDSGIGMPPDIVDRVLEPFFTTKEVGKGTGLGLSQVYGFVRQSNGHLNIYSESGVGTTIRLYFPAIHQDLTEVDHQAALGELNANTVPAHILVVEDNPELLELATSILRDAGYTILSASDATSALRIIHNDKDHDIDVVFSDIAMPGSLNGVSLAFQINGLRPDIKILLTTGFAPELVQPRKRLQFPLLQKPYRPFDLLQHIASLVAEQNPKSK